MRRLVCIAALFGSMAVVKARSSPGNSTDSRVDALLSIMGDLGYNHILAQSWKGNDPCDMWWGINCLDGQIRAITLMFMNLTGTISPRFADLTSLYVIDLSRNLLTGTIPLELTKMELHSLDLSYNRLHGRVPHFKTLVPNTKGNPAIVRDVPLWSGQHKLTWILSGGFGFAGLCCLIGAGICFFRSWKRKRSARASQPEQSEMVPQPQQNVALPPSQQNEILESENSVFSLETLREATQDFSISIGKGGSGFVYQGKLKDGREIAVKKMVVTAGGTGCSVFDAEVRVLSRVRHRNIVSLHGYCIQGDERLLVYELMAQGSLSKHLEKGYEAQKLDWSRRLIVALDVARGLEYLHTLASESQIYIHRDVKSANILLGKDLRAKIADFGYVRATTEDREPINTACVGTLGYMAPEYFDGGMLSRKADVYSFGVILLELITGKKACNKDDCNMSQDFIAMWFEKKKEDFWNSIDVDIDTEHETHQSVREVAELAEIEGTRQAAADLDRRNVSLRYIPVSFMQTIKSFTPATTGDLIVYMFVQLCGGSTSTGVFGRLLSTIVGGILLTSVTELSFNMFGLCAALSECLATNHQDHSCKNLFFLTGLIENVIDISLFPVKSESDELFDKLNR
ncbi:receptor-like kinase TMK2 [Raphanus sativus]|uniref:Receptor-like kinase TMK2 n=1 Tax=Raphanus sativus TaxID=3726 RepID=A0A9W3C6Z6_RAPSA|nr:receptor-like kinase TMK2 [Raphanus sativus]